VNKSQSEPSPTIEGALADRIGLLRTERGWSYERLSKELAILGCRVAISSLHKIERGTPRRPISVDELFALAAVFKMDVLSLAEPLAIRDRARVKRLLDRYARDVEEMVDWRQDAHETVEALLAAAKHVDDDVLRKIVSDWTKFAALTRGRFEDEHAFEDDLFRFLRHGATPSPFDAAINSDSRRVPGYKYHLEPGGDDDIGIRIQEHAD
jgi:transcriptional regulator with XRE-family HTH domain